MHRIPYLDVAKLLELLQELALELKSRGAPGATALLKQLESLARKLKWCRYEIEDLKNKYVLYVELPGASKDTVEVYVRGKVITVLARPEVKLPSAPSEYRVTVALNEDVDEKASKARIKNGILVVELPKKAMGKRVEVG